MFISQGLFQREASMRNCKGIDLFGGSAQAGITAKFCKAGANVTARAGTAFFGKGGQCGGKGGVFPCGQHHVGKARMQGQVGQLFAMWGELGAAVLFLHSTQQAQGLQGLRNGGFGRRREEGQIVRQRPPCQNINEEGGEVSLKDFRSAAG